MIVRQRSEARGKHVRATVYGRVVEGRGGRSVTLRIMLPKASKLQHGDNVVAKVSMREWKLER